MPKRGDERNERSGAEILKRRNCSLRQKIETLGLPKHAPEADVLNMAADYYDLILQ